ncbi:MAG: adenylate/guanylate cyclase domain-containing protein [Treponema sp.]|nr:adenylate/guanylate cyclase domain-containing protein [Treponema sp.]
MSIDARIKAPLLTALGAALFFSILSLSPFFENAENKIYDTFLRFRPRRQRLDSVVFLDVDDQSIARIGVFPWPRSVMAEGLLHLKEYGADTAIFDIEYIDKSPTQVDEQYLQQGLRVDYNRRLSGIGAGVADLLNAIGAGYIRGADAPSYIGDMTALIQEEGDALFSDTLKITRNNDFYLAQAAALFGNVWGTLNLQDEDLEGEQAERRATAEQRFSYPLEDRGGLGGDNRDILPPIPSFMEAVKGAGFTNVTVDRDGVRRRIFLVREVRDRWYLQLAFAPLVDRLGRPDIELHRRRLLMKTAEGKDLTIPLDESGAMLLDWPLEPFNDSYAHVPFVRLSLLDEYLAHIEEYLDALIYADNRIFPYITNTAAGIRAVFEAALEAKNSALAETSDEEFNRYLALRNRGLDTARQFSAAGRLYLEETLRESSPEASPGSSPEALEQEAAYCGALLDYIDTELNAIAETQDYLKKELGGKICLIGRVDTGTTDIGVNPFHGEYVNVGTHAVVLDTILSQSFITLLPPYWTVILIFILTPLVIMGISGFKPGLRIVAGMGGIVLTGALSLALFSLKGYFLSPLGPMLAMGAALIIRETIDFAGTEREKQFIRKAFSTYLSGDVVQEILADPGKLQLGGSKRRMTALFTDIQSFSTISEKLDPEDLVRLLNDYLSAMSNVVLEERGTIDKYEGDAIIAFFGAPLDLSDHALRACVSAVTMKRIEKELNRNYAENGLSPFPLQTRIGINTGTMVVGNMGTLRKMDYTIMGNAVNLASRLEGVNKQYGTWVLASEETVKEAGDRMLTRRLDRVRVVGINEPVQLYEILEIADRAPLEMLKLAELFRGALEIFENRDWSAAEAAFEAVLHHAPADGPAKLYLERCRLYLTKPPERNWDGIFTLTQK